MSETEIWSFIEYDFVKQKFHETALQMALEAVRDSRIFNAKPCGVTFSPFIRDDLKYVGLEKIYFFESVEQLSTESIAENICSFISYNQPKIILFPPSPNGTEIGARIAAKLSKSFASNCIEFEIKDGKIVARRPICNGVIHQYVEFLGEPPYVATINPKSLEALGEKEESAEAEIIRIQVKKVPSRIRALKRWKLPPSEMPVTEAPVVIGVGGAVEKDFMPVIEELAKCLGAAIGATRVAVDKGLVPVEAQIGATGKFINADVYIAVGISGSTRHTVGISNVKHIVAVNIDKNANIFKLTELGIIDDLYKVIPKLLDFIKQEGGCE